MKATLGLIVVILLGMVGSFIWFVKTWDKDAEPALSHVPAIEVLEEEHRA
ncbi:hypothetical protein MWU54_15920 [Marivita sp. S6314]|nr:hypothetical protein [Marivita sp. S6314]MCK0151530.1 hypothetical protein [Marivita sp. S6314]